MKVYDALDVRRFCEQSLRISYPTYSNEFKTMSTVVVASDFCKYVAAMAEQWPEVDYIHWPTMSEAHWPFMDQSVLFVFEEPIYIEFLIISESTDGRIYKKLPKPTPDEQPVVAFCLLNNQAVGHAPILDVRGKPTGFARDLPRDRQPQPTLHIHPDHTITDGWFGWGINISKQEHHPLMGYCARWERSFVEAVGHRMSTLVEPAYQSMPRPERRAIQRSQVPYRLLQLRTPERATEATGTTQVAWTKRWAVRGHWRNQPFGPRENPEYRQRWIDPYIKGPEDKPLDIRPDVFKLRAQG
jgi:hypothetical protein